jgi:hypothetical protein
MHAEYGNKRGCDYGFIVNNENPWSCVGRHIYLFRMPVS